MGLPEFGGEGRFLVGSGVGFLEADNVRRFTEGGEVPDGPLVSGVLLVSIGVEGEGASVMEDDPRVRDGGVEGAGGTVNGVKTHLFRVCRRDPNRHGF